MELDQRQLHAARQLGEAILRFIKTVELPKQVSTFTVPPEKLTEKVPNKNENRLLRVTEAAQILSLSQTMIYGLMSSGRLPSVKIGSARRIKMSEVLKLLNGT